MAAMAVLPTGIASYGALAGPLAAHGCSRRSGEALSLAAGLHGGFEGRRQLPIKHSLQPRRRTYTRAMAAQVAVQLPSVEEQQKLVEEMKVQLATAHADLPVGLHGRDDEALLLWFLKDRKFKVDDAVTKVAKAIQWRSELQVEVIAEVASETRTAYLTSHPDRTGRPVIIVNAALHFAKDDPGPTFRLCVYLLEQAIQRLPPNHDKILGIFDLRGFTSKNTDWKFVHFFIDLFFNYYPKRLGEVLFVDAPPIFQAGWTLVKPMLKKYSKLVRFCSADEVREYFTPETTPPTFTA